MLPMSYKRTSFRETDNGGSLVETKNTRNKYKCSLFDVSHMGQYRIFGDNRKNFLDGLVASDIFKLNTNQSLLTVFTNEKGNIMDDVIITNNDSHLGLVCNGVNKDKIRKIIPNMQPGGAILMMIMDMKTPYTRGEHKSGRPNFKTARAIFGK